jgi:serine protease AprX
MSRVRNHCIWGKRTAQRAFHGTAVVCLGLAAASGPVSADVLTDKSDLFIQKIAAAKPKTGWTNVIATFTGELTEEQKAKLKGVQADIYRNLSAFKMAGMRVPSKNLGPLASLSFVKRVSLDSPVEKQDEFTIGSSRADVAFQQYGTTGTGVTVAVVDSGIKSHNDLTNASWSSRVLASVNFVPNTGTTSDICGHGTHVAGIIAGNGNSSTGSGYTRTFKGVAPNSNLVNVRVLDGNGQGNVSAVLSGLQWVIDNRNTYNIRVINLSLGHPVGESFTTDPLCQAVEQAWKSGIVVVCAAGNNGRKYAAAQLLVSDNEGFGTNYGSIQSPANSPYVITVGATKSVDGNRANDRIATYSGRGPSRIDHVLKPDIVAPGNRVISTLAGNTYLSGFEANIIKLAEYSSSSSNRDSNKYFRLSGTSMAAPVVSGAAALMLEIDPTLSPDTVKARLMISADKWRHPDGRYDAFTFGAGYLNIAAALARTEVAEGHAVSPRVFRDTLGNVRIDGAQIVGGTQVIWGPAIGWGLETVTTLQVIWGRSVEPITQVIWGNGLLGEVIQPISQVIWGSGAIFSNPLWTDQMIWGESSGAVDLTSKALSGER